MNSNPVRGNQQNEAEDWLYDQIEESYNKKDSDFISIFRPDLNVPFWKDTKGEHWLDILPYTVGNNDPIGIRNLAPGSKTYKLELWVHYNIGLNGSFLCLYKNYKEPCPVCNYLAKLKNDYNLNKKTIDKIKAKRRVIYNIVCRDSAEEANKGIQVWETSHFLMEAKLSALAKMNKNLTQGRGWTPFPSIKNGRIVGFERVGDKENKQFIAHRFEVRNYEIPMELANSTYTLDDLIYKPTFEEVNESLTMGMDSPATEDHTTTANPQNQFVSHGSVVGPAPKVTCPAAKDGGVFGDTTDDFQECVMCEQHKACEEEYIKRNRN